MSRAYRPGHVRLLTAFLLILVLGAAIGMPRAGRFLVAEDAFDRADVAVVLSGSPVIRALAAADLYQQGRVGRVIVIPEPPEPARERLIQLKLLDPSLPPWPQRVLLASGIPPARIAALPDPIDGTINEAKRLRAFFGDDVPASLVVITSESASRRARYIFRRVFAGTSTKVLSFPSRYDPFEPDRWWTHPRNALTVVMEYQKFASNLLTLSFRR